MERVVLSELAAADDGVEVVERKGLGHPDTICDALADVLSRSLCREYRRRTGRILHHNVDKALLSGGRAAPAFGGGSVLSPIEIYLAGRAVTDLGTDHIPIDEIARESAQAWLAANLHALDADRHVRIRSLVHPGSQDLQTLFGRGKPQQVPLANDTSFGVGHAPLSALERLVLAIETTINGRERRRQNPAWGEDVKVMGIRCGDAVDLTVACAMIGAHLAHVDDYLHEKSRIADLVRRCAAEHGFDSASVAVNAADDPAAGDVYLTVTGTSAEAGDDGQVGRGNRVNGLITPCRPMSLEAAAGKNPVSHVGKIYAVTAQDMAKRLVRDLPEVSHAQCLLVSRIGAPITHPSLLHIGLRTRDGGPAGPLRPRAQAIAAEALAGIPGLVDDFVAGAIPLF
jgi:S-adenosylmethionine synthetase